MLLALLKQNPRNWVAYEQQTYISYGFGGWKSKVKLPTDSLPGENPLPGSCMAVVSLCLHVVAEMGGALWGLFYESTNPIPEEFALMTQNFPKAHLLRPPRWE